MRSSLAAVERRPGVADRTSGVEAGGVPRHRPSGAAIAELRPGRRFSGRYACVRKDRLTARKGSTRTCRWSCATAADRSRRASSATPTGSAARFERGDAIGSRGRVERFRGELVAELDDIRSHRAG